MNTECPANYDRITKDKDRGRMGQGGDSNMARQGQ